MKIHAPSRRLFLCGAGATLALPFLRSVLPKSAQAAPQGTPIRYLQVLSPYGPSANLFFGKRTPTLTPATHVKGEKLADIDGPISPMFGTEFDTFRPKMTLMRGIDTLVQNANHHYCFATCASSYASGVDSDVAPPVTGQASVDTIIAQSPKVYGDDVPAVRRVVNINPTTTDDYSNNRSFSWAGSGDELEMIRPVKETTAFFDAFATGFGAAAEADAREDMLMTAVYDDYRALRDGGRISSADRARLEAYMSLIADISKGAGNCTQPNLEDEADIEAKIDNQFRLLSAAMACDLTRVASITLGMSEGYGVRHAEHHAFFGNDQDEANGFRKDYLLNAKRVARLLTFLEAVPEGEKTMLDNALVYFTSQYGCVQIGGQHNSLSMPIMVAGGAGGTLAHGNYLDFRVDDSVPDPDRKGIAINNLLVTFMNCMGLASSDYEMPDREGYGYYADGVFDARPDGEFWLSTEGKRSPLPVLYAGQKLG